MAVYPSPSVVGDLWLTVTNSTATATTTFKAYARTPALAADSNMVSLRYLNGTTDSSLSEFVTGTSFTVQGVITYSTPLVANLVNLPRSRLPTVMTEDQEGRVALSTGQAPQARLQVLEPAGGLVAGVPALMVDQQGTGDIARFKDAGVDKVVIDGNGNVGIALGTQFLGALSDSVSAPSFSWTGETNVGIYRPATNTLGFVTNGIERMRVDTNGNVGIGTTAPQTKLQVIGDVSIKDFLQALKTIQTISGGPISRTYVVNGLTVSAKGCGVSGWEHVLAIDNTGAVQTWGKNSDGNLGRNNTTNSLAAVNISTFGTLSGRTVVAVAGGAYHTLAIDSTGAVHIWGNNQYGQLGNNSTTNSLIPINVSSFGSLSGRTVVAAAVGERYTVALDSTGAVHSCGINIWGTLGNNSTTHSSIPINVSTSGSLSGRTVVAITTISIHTVALDSTGAVHAWGYNGYGQLGNNTTSQSNIPINVSTFGSLSGRTVVTVAGGGYHTVALDSTGAVHTWGYNNLGQLGRNNTTDSLIPINVNTFGSLSGRTVVAVTSGFYHTVVLDSTGAVHTWGWNLFGQLGNNSTTNSLIPINVSSFGSLSGRTVVAVAAGTRHTLALDNSGVLHTWGNNAYGQLGNNTTIDSLIPISDVFMIINAAVGIGLAPTYQLQLSLDSAAKPASSTWTVSSDERLKTDVEVADYDRCYEIVSSLDLKSYNWNSNIPELMLSVGTDHHRLGWIAQELEPIFPKAINVVPDLYGLSNVLNVNFDQLYAVQYGAVKKMIDKIATLMDTVGALKQENDKNKQDIMELKAQLT